MAQTRERRRARRPQREIEERAPVKDDDRDEREDEETGGQDEGAVSQIRGVMSEAAAAVPAPGAEKFAHPAAKMAMEGGPGPLEDTVLPKLRDAGGMGGGLGEKLGGGKDKKGGAGDGTGKGRGMPIPQSVDVAAPLDVVYDQFT